MNLIIEVILVCEKNVHLSVWKVLNSDPQSELYFCDS